MWTRRNFIAFSVPKEKFGGVSLANQTRNRNTSLVWGLNRAAGLELQSIPELSRPLDPR
jgi:hypothetical protein